LAGEEDAQESQTHMDQANKAFRYRKVVVERPLRLHSQFTRKAIESLRFCSGDGTIREELYDQFGAALFEDFDSVRSTIEKTAE
jgi:type I restriction enzyme M protein